MTALGLVFGAVGYAQPKPAAAPQEKKMKGHHDDGYQGLNLTEEQRARIKEIRQQAKADAAKAAAKAAGTATTDGKPKKPGVDLEALKRKAQEKAAAARGGEGHSAPAAEEPAPVADDPEAAKKARLEEMKRKAQEAAAKRRAQSE